MSKPAAETGQPTGVANWILHNADLILELPEPGKEYYMKDIFNHPEKFATVRSDLSDKFSYYTRELQEHGAINSVGKDPNYNRSKWETDAQVYEYVEQFRSQQETLPCGHRSGFRTITVGEEYECGHEFCDAVHDDETIEEVYG